MAASAPSGADICSLCRKRPSKNEPRTLVRICSVVLKKVPRTEMVMLSASASWSDTCRRASRSAALCGSACGGSKFCGFSASSLSVAKRTPYRSDLSLGKPTTVPSMPFSSGRACNPLTRTREPRMNTMIFALLWPTSTAQSSSGSRAAFVQRSYSCPYTTRVLVGYLYYQLLFWCACPCLLCAALPHRHVKTSSLLAACRGGGRRRWSVRVGVAAPVPYRIRCDEHRHSCTITVMGAAPR